MESPTGVARVSNVQKAIARLPLRKASGLDGLSAEHVKYGGCVLALHSFKLC